MREKILQKGKKFFSHELISGSSIVFTGSMIGNILAFFFNLFVVRKFTYIEYGEFAALISLFTLSTIPAQSLQPVLIRFSSQYLAKKELGKAETFYKKMLFLTFCIASTIFLGFIVFYPWLRVFFHINNFPLFLLLGFTVGTVYISVPNIMLLQAMLQFSFLAFTNSLGAVVKLIAGMGFITIGFGVFGAVGAIFISLAIPYLLTFLPIKKIFSIKQEKQEVKWKEIFTYAILSGVSLFALSSFTSADVLLVKHFFTNTSAGLYAGLSLVGRVIFYFTAPITSVMFPLVVKKYEKKENYQSLLYVAFLFVALPSFLITIFYFLFPHFTIFLFLGGKAYYSVGNYLGWYGIFLSIFSLLNVLVTFFLSVKKTNIVYLVAFGALLQAILIVMFHTTFTSVIAVSLLVTLGLLILLLLYYFKEYGLQKK